MKKLLFLLLIAHCGTTHAQVFIGKVGIATNTIKDLTYDNVDATMEKYGYKFGDYYEVKHTKYYYNASSDNKMDIVVTYFSKNKKKLDAILLMLTKDQFEEAIKQMKFYQFKNETFTFMDNNGLRWVKIGSAFRFFTDEKNHTISVFYMP